jgi:uncharacterized membrane protein (DUF485 family)/predicted RNA-binding Zn-ribbon protein involved in translation (DUF1610 family)
MVVKKKSIKKNNKKANVKKAQTKTNPILNPDFIRICPNCGSKDVEYYTDEYRRQYRCLKCGFFANEFPEIKKDDYAKESKEIIKNNLTNKNKFKDKRPLWIKVIALIIIAIIVWAVVASFFMEIFGVMLIPAIITGILILILFIISTIYVVDEHKG